MSTNTPNEIDHIHGIPIEDLNVDYLIAAAGAAHLAYGDVATYAVFPGEARPDWVTDELVENVLELMREYYRALVEGRP